MGVKVGDKVRSLVTEFDVRKGCIYTVSQVGDGDIWVFDDVDAEYFLLSNEFEPVAVADSNGNQHGSQPKFKVGDRVRCVKGQDDRGYGCEGVVREVRTTYTMVDFGEGFDGHDYNDHCWNFFSADQQLVLVDAPLTIREGRFYRTRDGRKVGPMRPWTMRGTGYQWESEGYLWKDDGENYDKDSGHTIIAEWTDEPVAAVASSNDYAYGISHATTGFTVPLDAPEFANDNDEPDGKLQVCNLEIAYQMVQTGVCTINEVRKILGLPTIASGHHLAAA